MNHRIMFRALPLLAIFATLASAQIDVKMYRQAFSRGGSEQRTLRIYLGGAGEALGTANGKLMSKRQPLLYCAPETLTLNVDNLVSIIDNWIKKMSNGTTSEELDKLPVVSVLLEGLMDTFPCPQKPEP